MKLRSIKTRLVWHVAGLLNWNFDHILAPAADRSFRQALGWWFEARLEHLFHRCYVGSEQELADGIEFAMDGVRDDYLTPLQREIKHRLVEFRPLREEAK